MEFHEMFGKYHKYVREFYEMFEEFHKYVHEFYQMFGKYHKYVGVKQKEKAIWDWDWEGVGTSCADCYASNLRDRGNHQPNMRKANRKTMLSHGFQYFYCG